MEDEENKNTGETLKIGLINQWAHILYILQYNFLTIGYLFNIYTFHCIHVRQNNKTHHTREIKAFPFTQARTSGVLRPIHAAHL